MYSGLRWQCSRNCASRYVFRVSEQLHIAAGDTVPLTIH